MVPDVVVVDHHDSYTWNLVHLVASVTGVLPTVVQHDGSLLRLRKIAADHDPTDREAALAFVQHHQRGGEVLTGILYVEPEPEDMVERLNVTATPLNALGEAELCPGPAALAALNAELR